MNHLEKSIYKVITSSGTGTAFKAKGHHFAITNYHVIKGNRVVALEDSNKERHLAYVVMVNPEVDLAFLNVESLRNVEGLITIEEEIELINTQKIYISGYPFGMPYTITEGIVSSTSQPMRGRHYIQTDAAVNPGNSGGPMFNADGVLMGVTTSKFTQADNVGFGIKHDDVIKQINDYTSDDNVFRVKCNSCDNFIETKTAFCPHCGNTIDESVFEEYEKSPFAKFIEDGLEQININPILCRAGKDFWEFYKGSALIRIFIVDKNYLFATSPINKLPKQNLKELFKYLTSNAVSPYTLGIHNNQIYVSYRTHLTDIYSDNKEDIRKHINDLSFKADELDDFLIDKYACERSTESRKVG